MPNAGAHVVTAPAPPRKRGSIVDTCYPPTPMLNKAEMEPPGRSGEHLPQSNCCAIVARRRH
eukprot:13492159-Alexandrium_andersonii.AAC.1